MASDGASADRTERQKVGLASAKNRFEADSRWQNVNTIRLQPYAVTPHLDLNL
jgi:hypothetical protein